MTKFDYKNLSEIDMINVSEQIPLSDYANMGEDLPRYAQGLFDEPPGPGMRRKRRKLADFNTDEKTARRKLKNRIAAQTARDRKRIETEMQCEKLSETKEEVQRLRKDNESLRNDNASLRDDNARLRHENAELRQKLELALSGRSQSNIKRKRPKFVDFGAVKKSNDGNESSSGSISSESTCSDPQFSVVNPILTSAHCNQKTSGACLLMQNEVKQVASPSQTAAIQVKTETSQKLENLPPKKRHLVRYTQITARLYRKQGEQITFGQVQAFYQILLSVIFQATSKILSRNMEIETLPEMPQEDTTQSISKSLKYQLAYLHNTSRLNKLRQKYSQSSRPQDIVRSERLSMLPSLPLQARTLKLMKLLNPVQNAQVHPKVVDPMTTTHSSMTCSTESSSLKSLSNSTSQRQMMPLKTSSQISEIAITHCPLHRTKESLCLACKTTPTSTKQVDMSVETLRQINLINYVLLNCKTKQTQAQMSKPRSRTSSETATQLPNVQT